MQGFDQLGGRHIFVLLSRLAEGRGNADLALQFGGAFQGFAALLIEQFAVLEKFFLGALDFLFVFLAQFTQRVFIARRALQSAISQPG